MFIYLVILILISTLLTYEYWALTYNPNHSFLFFAQKSGLISESIKLSTRPGGKLSLWLGWAGLLLMLLMNVYSARKRFSFMSKWGSVPFWLNFHIFCGLLGPILILFHCNFKVRGAVGISFWSMVISFSSGVIGRYFYTQINGKKSEFAERAEFIEKKLLKFLETQKIKSSPEVWSQALHNALLHVGATLHSDMLGEEENSLSSIKAFFSSMLGDIRSLLFEPPRPAEWPASTSPYLLQYALFHRRAQFLEPFQRIMGHWHTFHFPFAVFMYLAAIVHLISSYMFTSHMI